MGNNRERNPLGLLTGRRHKLWEEPKALEFKRLPRNEVRLLASPTIRQSTTGLRQRDQPSDQREQVVQIAK